VELLTVRSISAIAQRHNTRQKILNWQQALKFPNRPRVSREAVDLMQRLMCEAEDRLGSSAAVRASVPTSAGYNRRSGFYQQPVLGVSDGADQIKVRSSRSYPFPF
jgi:protein-serine/threonine kinase